MPLVSERAPFTAARLIPDASALFPAGVSVLARAVTESLDGLHAAEHALVARAIAKRRHEFATGRRLARELLARNGVTDFALLSDTDRAPLWPKGFVGSLSHSHGMCVAAVARADGFAALGIDVEEADAVRPELWRRVLDDAETRWLRVQPQDGQLALAAVFFSAKESVYKAQFPLLRARLGFHDVSLELEPARGVFRARTPGFAAPLVGSFAIRAPWVLSGLALRPGDVPS